MSAVTFDYEMTDSSSEVLSSVPFHVSIWILLTMGIVGNFLVVLWRLSRKRDHRASIFSLLIIILAVSDFLYCLHLLLLEGLVAEAFFASRPAHILPSSSTATVCGASGSLSIISCSLALWITFDIAIYSVQSIGGTNCCCCCSLAIGTKGKLCTTIFFQCLFTVAILIFSITYPLNDIFHSPYYKSWEAFYDNDHENTTIRSMSLQIGDLLATCAFVQSTGIHFFANYTMADQSNDRCQLGNIDYSSQILGGCLLSIISFLVVACAVCYFQVCRKLRTINRQPGRSWRSDEQHPQCRLSVIVLVNTVCWFPATILHWMSYAENFIGDGSCDFSTASTAANILLISISPAVNPLIYTFTEHNFLQSIRSCFRQLKCHVSLRHNVNSHKLDKDSLTGIDRCTCIPCIKCIRRWEDFDTDSWRTEETTTLLSSDCHIPESN